MGFHSDHNHVGRWSLSRGLEHHKRRKVAEFRVKISHDFFSRGNAREQRSLIWKGLLTSPQIFAKLNIPDFNYPKLFTDVEMTGKEEGWMDPQIRFNLRHDRPQNAWRGETELDTRTIAAPVSAKTFGDGTGWLPSNYQSVAQSYDVRIAKCRLTNQVKLTCVSLKIRRLARLLALARLTQGRGWVFFTQHVRFAFGQEGEL